MPATVEELVHSLTLEEKAGLCSGQGPWHTKAVERLGIPAMMVSDGPHGLRAQRPGAEGPNDSVEAVCYPAGCAAAASFALGTSEAVSIYSRLEWLNSPFAPRPQITGTPSLAARLASDHPPTLMGCSVPG